MKRVFVVIALLTLALPATAGHYVLKYEEKGQVSVSIFSGRDGRETILFRALPLTADRTPGPAVLRLDGVYVAQWRNPAYEFEFNLDVAEIPSLKGELVIPWLKGDRGQSVDLRRLPVGVHAVEVYFASKDGRGKLDRNRTAAPATQFRVEEIDPPRAATTESGAPLTPGQLEAAVKQSYEQGANVGKEAATREREKLLAEIRKATDEVNELRRQVALGSDKLKVMPAQRYLPVAWKQANWPAANEVMVLVDPNGKIVADAKIVEHLPQQGRLWVIVTVPVDLDLKGYTIQRQKGRREEGQ